MPSVAVTEGRPESSLTPLISQFLRQIPQQQPCLSAATAENFEQIFEIVIVILIESAMMPASWTVAAVRAFVREHGLEGIVAKRADSVYQPGKRSGLWAKHRISLGQEFVVGGYVPSNLGLDSLVVGFYRGTDLIYASRVRAGFIPATRRKVFER